MLTDATTENKTEKLNVNVVIMLKALSITALDPMICGNASWDKSFSNSKNDCDTPTNPPRGIEMSKYRIWIGKIISNEEQTNLSPPREHALRLYIL